MSTEEKPFLEVRDLHRWFDGVRAVNGVSFDLPAGAVVGLIGANGAGKTTAMRMLATLDQPDRGTIKLGGIDIVEYPNEVRRRIGWMPDHFAPYPDTTVADYLDFFGRAHGLRGPELARRLDEVADFTDLRPLADRPMDKLSKGQTQRLCLARTLLNDPEFLLLDEPAAGLDPKARLEFKNLVRVLRERGKTILISSHILSELGEMCDTLIFMDRGAVMHHGDTDTIRRGGATTTCFVNIMVHLYDPSMVSISVRVFANLRYRVVTEVVCVFHCPIQIASKFRDRYDSIESQVRQPRTAVVARPLCQRGDDARHAEGDDDSVRSDSGRPSRFRPARTIQRTDAQPAAVRSGAARRRLCPLRQFDPGGAERTGDLHGWPQMGCAIRVLRAP